jgi:hypothetical protein
MRRAVRKVCRTFAPDLLARFDDRSLCRALQRSPSDWNWEMLRRCPARRLDAAAAQVGKELFVFGGYVSGDVVLSTVDVLDLERGVWRERFPMPEPMAHSHLALTTDGVGTVFAVSGQWGNQCRPATRAAFALDVKTRRWTELPALPSARYAATMQLWNGRLHVVGGSLEDRHTPAKDHWSLGVAEGRATETAWRAEVPIPRGGPHRASAILDGKLYVFGGQEGDWVPIPGHPDYVGTGDLVDEWHHPEVYMLVSEAREWRRMADMPVAVSHTEFSALRQGNRLILFGGQHAKNREARVLTLTDVIQGYDAERDAWTVLGTMPYRVKTNVIAQHGDWIYSALGQRDRGPSDPAPGEIVAHTWRAKMPPGWRA